MISLAGGNVTGPFTFTSWISSISSSLLLVLIVPIARPQKNQFHFVCYSLCLPCEHVNEVGDDGRLLLMCSAACMPSAACMAFKL